jgi:hypothetical protein
MEYLIEFPDVDGDVEETIFCRAYARKGARQLRVNVCSEADTDSEAFSNTIKNAVKYAQVTPATVDGTKERVYLHYRVFFMRIGATVEVSVYPNWGNNTDKFGVYYQAPQRVLHNSYPSGCRVPRNRLSREFARGHFLIFTTITIDEHGKPSGEALIEYSENSMRNDTCTSMLRRTLEEADYIPGNYEGKSVEATYVEVLFHNPGGEN